MRFKVNIENAKVIRAAKIASDLLSPGSKMIQEISQKNDFQYDSGDGISVAANLISPRKPVEVSIYTPWNPFTAAIGYFDGKSIFINSRKLPGMSESDIVANMIHEYAHFAGYHHRDAGFWNKRRENYKTENKCKFSVPYFLSENISKWL